MNRTLRLTTALIGGYAGLLGMAHGFFARQQGPVAPDGLLFNAIGPPCDPATVYHACLPALTLLPSLAWGSWLTLLIGLAVVVWSVFLSDRRFGGLVLISLSVVLLLVGGGFIPAFTGILAGAAVQSAAFWARRAKTLGRLWPGALVAYFVWIGGQLLLGQVANDWLLGVGSWPLLVELALLLLALGSAAAREAAA